MGLLGRVHQSAELWEANPVEVRGVLLPLPVTECHFYFCSYNHSTRRHTKKGEHCQKQLCTFKKRFIKILVYKSKTGHVTMKWSFLGNNIQLDKAVWIHLAQNINEICLSDDLNTIVLDCLGFQVCTIGILRKHPWLWISL